MKNWESHFAWKKLIESRYKYNFTYIVFRRILWFFIFSIIAIIFISLLITALVNERLFVNLMLILALFTIFITFLLIVINVFYIISIDWRAQKFETQKEKAREAVGLFLQDPSNPEYLEIINSLMMNHLDIVESVCQALSEKDKNIIITALRDLDATSHIENTIVNSYKKWDIVKNILLLGWLNDPESIPLLKEASLDNDHDIGYAAVYSLSKYNDPEAYSSLLEALQQGHLSGSRVSTSIESSKYDNPIPSLVEKASDYQPRVRSWIAYLIGRTKNRDGLPILVRLARDEDATVRMSAAKAFGAIGDRSARSSFKVLLADKDWLVRSQAAKSIGIIGDVTLIKDLLPLLRDREWWVRQNSALALEKLGYQTVPYLVNLLKDEDRFARNKAAEVLGRLGVVSEQVKKLSGTKSEAKGARDFLLRIGRADAVNVIEGEIFKVKPATQKILTEILREIGDKGSIPVLELLQNSNEKEVRESAEHAIELMRKAV